MGLIGNTFSGDKRQNKYLPYQPQAQMDEQQPHMKSLMSELESAPKRIEAVGGQVGSPKKALLPSILEGLRRTDYAATNLLRELIPGQQGSETPGFDPGAAIMRGLRGEEKITGKDLVSQLGVSDKPLFEANVGPVKISPSAAGIAGFATEVLNPLNPVNWLTFGTGGAVKKLAAEGGKEVMERGIRHGITAGLTVPGTGKTVAKGVIPGSKPVGQVLAGAGEGIAKTEPYQKLAKSFSTKYAPEMADEKVLIRSINGAEQQGLEDFLRKRNAIDKGEEQYARTLREIIEGKEREYISGVSRFEAQRNLYDEIRKRGGIGIGKGDAFYSEYIGALPKNVRSMFTRKDGLPLDEMADELGMNSKELLDQLRGIGGNFGNIKKSGRNLTPEEASDALYGSDREYREAFDALNEIGVLIRGRGKGAVGEVPAAEAFTDIRKAREAIEQMSRGQVDKVDQEITRAFRGLAEADKQAITNAVGLRDTSGLEERLVPYYETAVKSLEAHRKALRGAGILEREMEKYVPFIATGTRLSREMRQKLVEQFGTGAKQFENLDDLHNWYAKYIPNIRERTTKAVTPSEVNEILNKKFFETDIEKILSTYSARAIKAQNAKQFFDATIAKYGVRLDDKAALKKLPDGYGLFRVKPGPGGGLMFEPVNVIGKKAGIGKETADIIALPSEFASHINEYMGAFFDPTLKGTVWDYVNAVNTIFKTTAYLWNPGHLMRDATSNAFQLWLMGMRNPARWADGVGVLLGKKLNPAGLKYNSEQIMKMARDYGLIGTEMVQADIGRSVLSRMRYSKAMAKATRSVDDVARISGFVYQLAKGLSPDEAAFQVKKYLFDYFDLTPFERKWMKTFVPFWTWTRKNMPLMFQEVVRQPGKFAAVSRAQDYISQPYQQDDVPEWLRKGAPMLLPGMPGNRQFITSYLPYADMANTPSDLISMSSPVFRVPYELASGVQTFSGHPIENKLDYALGQFVPIYSRGRTIMDAGNPRRASRILSTLGLPPLYGEEQAKTSGMYEERDRLREVIQKLKDAGAEVPTASELTPNKKKKNKYLNR